MTNLQLFIYTFNEYKRFALNLPIESGTVITDNCSDTDYIAIQTRLMLLRKYYSNTGNVSIKKLISEAVLAFPNESKVFNKLNENVESVFTQQLQHILSDGTKQDLYSTIEDAIYGLYLHADENRIERLTKTDEALRCACSRKFIFDIEEILYEFYNKLDSLGVSYEITQEAEHSSVIYMGNPDLNSQNIKKSEYWNNLYGHDATEDDMKKILSHLSSEELIILFKGIEFLEKLKVTPMPIKELQKCVYPLNRKNWGDFSEARNLLISIQNPGIDNFIRYSDDGTLAYVRILKNVKEAFCIDAPHVINDIYEISFARWKSEWKVFSFGGHLESMYEK